MNVPKWIRPLFVFAGLYDGILGLLFLLLPMRLFAATDVPPPNHMGYVQFPAFLLVIFAIMFFNIAKDPVGNKNLIVYGILLKIAYCSVVFIYKAIGNMPSMWMPFAYFDLAFMIVFIVAQKSIQNA